MKHAAFGDENAEDVGFRPRGSRSRRPTAGVMRERRSQADGPLEAKTLLPIWEGAAREARAPRLRCRGRTKDYWSLVRRAKPTPNKSALGMGRAERAHAGHALKRKVGTRSARQKRFKPVAPSGTNSCEK